MFRGDRSEHVALGLAILILIAAWSALIWQIASQRQFYADTAQQQAERAAANADSEFQDCLAHSARVDVLQCVEGVAEAKRAAQRAEYDLAAQQEMAFWTPWMLVSSMVATSAAVIGVVYVAGTLRQMQETNRIAHNQLLASRRPWITVEAVPAESILFGSDSATLEVTFIARNVGDSPAQNLRIGEKLYLSVASDEDEIEKRRNEIRAIAFENDSVGATIFPEKTFKQGAPYCVERQCISNGSVCPIIFGAVFYQIPEDEEFRITEFYYFVLLNKWPPFKDWPAKAVERQTVKLLDAPYRPRVT